MVKKADNAVAVLILLFSYISDYEWSVKLLDYLSNVQKRPGMYMADGTCLRDLELILSGYGAALHAHDIENDLTQFNQEFR